VQRRAGDEAREIVGGGLEWRRVEAEAAGEDHRAGGPAAAISTTLGKWDRSIGGGGRREKITDGSPEGRGKMAMDL
jgi:hypothetical protein